MRAGCWYVLATAACGFHPGAASQVGGDGPPIVPQIDAAPPDARAIDAAIDARPDAPPDAPPPVVPQMVQSNTTMQSGGASVAATFTGAQLAGHFNLVAIAWFGATQVASVTDTAGNTYTHVGQDSQGSLNQDYFYTASTLTAATHTVTATFNSAASGSLDIRIVEYSGIAPTGSVETTVMATANTGTGLDSGAANTSHAHDFMVGVGTDSSAGATPGTGFTQDVIAWGDLIEHQEVTTTGSYHATMSQSGSSGWILRVFALAVADPANN
jgi:hypothetical protein